MALATCCGGPRKVNLPSLIVPPAASVKPRNAASFARLICEKVPVASKISGRSSLKRLRGDAHVAAKRGELHLEVQAAAREVVEFGGKAAHLHVRIEREIGDLDPGILEGGGAAHIAKGAADPRLLDHDLPRTDDAGLDTAQREFRIGEPHEVAIALENEIHILRLDALRRRQPAAGRAGNVEVEEIAGAPGATPAAVSGSRILPVTPRRVSR